MWPFKKQAREPLPWENLEEPDYTPSARQTKRFFDAAQADRLLGTWAQTGSSIDEILRRDLLSLQVRSREQVRNNDYAKHFRNLLWRHVVGPNGIRVQTQIRNAAGELDVPANRIVDAAFQEWATDQCDVSGQLSLLDVQRLFTASLAQDGEFVCKFHYGRRYGIHGVQIEVIDPLRIATTKDGEVEGGNIVRLGVEYDGPKPVALWLHPMDSRHNYQEGRAERHPMHDGRRPLLAHCFLPEYVSQPRGIPWLSTALYRLRMVNGYENAAIVAARAGANKLGFIQEGLDSNGSYTGDGYENDDPDGPILQDLEPGTFERLPPGTTVQSYDPQYPHDQYESFMKRTLMGGASGLDVGYNVFANDPENVSYSTLRQFELENRDSHRIRQTCLIKFMRLLRNQVWLPTASLSGAFDSRRTVASMLPVSLKGRAWDWVDPEKDGKAHDLKLKNRLTSRSQIIRDNGGDPDEVFAEIAAENTKLSDLGIAPQSN